MNEIDTFSVPHLEFLPRTYGWILALTKRHGLGTLSRWHRWLYPNGQTFRLRTGSKMYLPPDPHFFGYLSQVHEKHVADAISDFVREDSVCIDIGANIGFFTLMMADKVGPRGKVFAVEPIPENFRTLTRNARLNKEHKECIKPMHFAASDTCGQLGLVRRSESTLHEVTNLTSEDASIERIGAITIDSLIEEMQTPPIALIKIDVEGHESAVVRGAENSLRNGRIDRMLIEVTPGAQANEINDLLKPYAAKIVIWFDGQWRASDLRQLSDRTDVLVEFNNLELAT